MNAKKTNSGEHEPARPKRSGVDVQRLAIRPGARVVIKGDHPWKGHSGTVESEMHTPVGAMWRVALDSGMSAGARTEFLDAV